MKAHTKNGVTTYDFGGGKKIIIMRGGEAIPDNTYGFEIEFCSHDSSVFAFTHVDVFRLTVERTINGGLTTGTWKIETDSNDVFELVTAPLQFATIDEARQFRSYLTLMLIWSVIPEQAPSDGGKPIYAMRVGDWAERLRTMFNTLFNGVDAHPPMTMTAVAMASWEEVGQQLTLANVDDGINIPAARLRHLLNKPTDTTAPWENYVNGTVLSRSEKSWDVGYLSQMNMPMTLVGYLLYCRRKYERGKARMDSLVLWAQYSSEDGQYDKVTDTRLQRDVETWFWRSLIWNVSCTYFAAVEPKFNMIRRWNAKVLPHLSYDDVRKLAFIHVMTGKILTGALGGLSEPNQLRLQQHAWDMSSTAAMVADSPEELAGTDGSLADIDRGWLEYHSYLKDLTGLWFKAALFDVIDKEGFDPGFLQKVSAALKDDRVWREINALLMEHSFVSWSDRVRDIRSGYSDDLTSINQEVLLGRIGEVAASLAAALIDPRAEPGYRVPHRRSRPFLDYSAAVPWEARFDTLYPPLARPGDTTTYLVEHRFN